MALFTYGSDTVCMTATVLHYPRVAWDGALAFVRAPLSLYSYDAFAQRVHDEMGPAVYEELQDTHARVVDNYWRTGGDRYVTDVEAAKWRARLEDLLHTRPDLAKTVVALSRSL